MIRYKKEFKQSLVEMHNQGRSYTDLSAEYGPSVDSIRNWVKLYAVHEVDGEKWTQADVNALQKENDKLREELEILKRAAVLLAQKSINWTIFIQLLRQHLRYDWDYKN